MIWAIGEIGIIEKNRVLRVRKGMISQLSPVQVYG